MEQITLQTIHKDLLTLEKEIEELKNLLYMEPELREEIIEEIEAARERMKTEHIEHKDILKEFLKE